MVLRIVAGFPATDFACNVCKSVRANHVQTTTHWRRQWRRASTLPPDPAMCPEHPLA